MSLRPIKKVRLYETVIEQIREMINTGKFPPGTRLPPERELAGAFNVGRPAVREALKILDAAGILDIRQGSGIYVREPKSGGDKQTMVLSLLLEKNDLISLLELRKILEIGTVRLAAQRATPQDIKHMEEACKSLETRISNEKGGAAEDYLFHYRLAMATHNRAIINIFSAIADLYGHTIIRNMSQSLQIPGRPRAMLKEHEMILDAVRRRNPAEAERCMAEHLASIEKKIMGGDTQTSQPASGGTKGIRARGRKKDEGYDIKEEKILETEIQSFNTPQGSLEIRKGWCKGCCLCVDACPRQLISVDELGKVQVDRPEECQACGLCEAICPDFAIKVNKDA